MLHKLILAGCKEYSAVRPPLASIGDRQASQAHPPNSADQGKETTPRHRRVREDENMVLVRSTRYTKLECVGRGGSSKVFKVLAQCCVKLDQSPNVAAFHMVC